MKSRLISAVATIIAWMGLDFVIHGHLLAKGYAQTAHLWRPCTEMNPIVMHGSTIIAALVFILIYCQMVPNKTLTKGIKLGILVGILTGTLAAMSYAYMPISKCIAIGWLLANVIKFTTAGIIAGYFMKDELKLG